MAGRACPPLFVAVSGSPGGVCPGLAGSRGVLYRLRQFGMICSEMAVLAMKTWRSHMANDSRDRVVQKQTQECDSFSRACGKLINQLRAVYMPSEAKRNKRKASGGSKALFSVFGSFSFYMLWACHWMLLSGGRAQPEMPSKMCSLAQLFYWYFFVSSTFVLSERCFTMSNISDASARIYMVFS